MALETDTLSGTVIGDQLEIGGLLGRGGMGNVYEAYHKGLGCVVAVKVLHPKLIESNDAIKRFQSEARVASLVQHPNLVVTHLFGLVDQKVPYIVMEKLDGISISQYLRQHQYMDIATFQQVFQQCCAGLAAIHARGIVHRDIKPSNIILLQLGDAWQAKIADFGIAKAIFSEAGLTAQKLTQTGEVIGTPLYMSPEQCQSQPLDQRSDIYALGCVMYECLTGKRPFDSDNPFEVMVHHSNEDPKPLDAVRPELKNHRALTAVVMHTLQKSPDHRPQTMHNLLEELKDAQSGQVPVLLRPKRLPKHFWRYVKLAAVLTVLVGAMVGATTFLLDQSARNSSPTPINRDNPQELFNEAARLNAADKHEDAQRYYKMFLSQTFDKSLDRGHWTLSPSDDTMDTVNYVARAVGGLDECAEQTGKKWGEVEPWYQLCDAVAHMQQTGLRPKDKTYDIMRDKLGNLQSAIEEDATDIPSVQLRLGGIIEYRLARALELRLENSSELPADYEEVLEETLNRYLLAEKYYEMTAAADSSKKMERSINLSRLGAMQAKMGQFAEARKNTIKAIDINDWSEADLASGTVDAFSNLAYIDLCLGRFASAEKNYNQLLNILLKQLRENRIKQPTYATLRINALKDKAGCLSLSGKHEQALAVYKQAFAEKQDNGKLRAELAVDIAYEELRMGDTKSATTMLHEARSAMNSSNREPRKTSL